MEYNTVFTTTAKLQQPLIVFIVGSCEYTVTKQHNRNIFFELKKSIYPNKHHNGKAVIA